MGLGNVKNYRNKSLLNLAKNVPYCMSCGRANDGTIVAAHSNQYRDGHGRGIKSNDYRIAYICSVCHYNIDEGVLCREEKVRLWEEAHRKTIGWLFENYHVIVE